MEERAECREEKGARAAYLNYTLSSTRWRLGAKQTACLSLWPDGQLHDNCVPSIGVVHPLRV